MEKKKEKKEKNAALLTSDNSNHTIKEETAKDKASYAPLKHERRKSDSSEESYVEAQNKKMEQKTFFSEANKQSNNDQLDEENFLDSKIESIEVSGSGHAKSNGEYRWFLHDKKWVKFDDAEPFVIDGNVPVADVYNQLKSNEKLSFRWPSDVIACWVISDMERKHIYYASPMRRPDQIPKGQWISVIGNKPEPTLTTGQHQSEYHDIPDFLMNNGLAYSTIQTKKSNGELKPKLSEQTIPEDENEENDDTQESAGDSNDKYKLIGKDKANDVNDGDNEGEAEEEEEEHEEEQLSDLES
ncbi:hypothetical protein RFI_11251 [Reticulomyxa filosa]|uniref:Uncharacterized protein n=1 Tax=Reticulomyxa filosa TaxID=46433 RepID=X6NIV2_RETFI|nr:hypothetical protein RFI_11251 [Reticulomyxa filosa]|eukprot:ETO25886.1 hypothetical protein RFI_11251 [Reticulomyxa filosa]